MQTPMGETGGDGGAPKLQQQWKPSDPSSVA